MNDEYPSGGNYPETEEDWAEHLLRLLESASPDQLNNFSVVNHKRGGKFAAFASLLQGLITIDDFNRMAEENGWGPGVE